MCVIIRISFGNVNACLALLNAYLSRQMDLLEKKYAKDIMEVKMCDDTLSQKNRSKHSSKMLALYFGEDSRL